MSAAKTVIFRPVGPAELKLIEDSGRSAFPPRLASQPILRFAVETATLAEACYNGIVGRIELIASYRAEDACHRSGTT